MLRRWEYRLRDPESVREGFGLLVGRAEGEEGRRDRELLGVVERSCWGFGKREDPVAERLVEEKAGSREYSDLIGRRRGRC